MVGVAEIEKALGPDHCNNFNLSVVQLVLKTNSSGGCGRWFARLNTMACYRPPPLRIQQTSERGDLNPIDFRRITIYAYGVPLSWQLGENQGERLPIRGTFFGRHGLPANPAETPPDKLLARVDSPSS